MLHVHPPSGCGFPCYVLVLFDTFIVLGFTTATLGIFAWLSHVPTGPAAGNLGSHFRFDLFHPRAPALPPKAESFLQPSIIDCL